MDNVLDRIPGMWYIFVAGAKSASLGLWPSRCANFPSSSEEFPRSYSHSGSTVSVRVPAASELLLFWKLQRLFPKPLCDITFYQEVDKSSWSSTEKSHTRTSPLAFLAVGDTVCW